ncbi:MAG: PglZ domain-containing protein [Bacteroidetes bacterium]|nr:PglZ domain-containing protein [Bacteroidota bacterium]
MTDKWFIQDIEHQIKKRKRTVLVDPSGQCSFLLPLLNDKEYKILSTDSSLTEQWQTVKEELFLRQEAEKHHKDAPVIFYVTRPREQMSFLLDYCYTHGCLDLTNMVEWLKKKLFASTGLQIQMENPLLLTAAKLGIGKDLGWWKKILQNLEELISIEDELLPFLHDPESYLNNKDEDIRRLFEEKLFELTGMPYISKPPKTLANEVVKRLFDGLAYNDVPASLLQLYYRWIDSETYRSSLHEYIDKYSLDANASPWTAHQDHCFISLDKKALEQLTANLHDKRYISDRIKKILSRVTSKKVNHLVPGWWNDVITLLNFDTGALSTCTDFSKIVNFYTGHFYAVDRAMRNLYCAFLQDESVIRPLQQYYDNLNLELLQQWYSCSTEYKPDQAGYLVKLLKNSQPGIAVIVGDGLRYEIAEMVAVSLENKASIEKKIMLADMPSETEHNMSAIYDGEKVFPLHKDREKSLKEKTGKEITFMNLEALHYGVKADYLVLTYKDIDSAGEKLQQGAIKLFKEFEYVLSEKISLLLNMGYHEVHLITDHGFVLTGLLDEADKIEPNAKGKKEVHERYIRTVERQENEDWLEFKSPHGDYGYVYASKNYRPFKSKGVYGYSHGGFTPQEIILPDFTFSKEKDTIPGLSVKISNKEELAEITGDVFGIKLQGAAGKSDLFASSRKVQILLYSGNTNYGSSSIINMEAGKTESLEFSFKGHTEVQAVVVDASTQEQLDLAIIKQSNLRDLGGL